MRGAATTPPPAPTGDQSGTAPTAGTANGGPAQDGGGWQDGGVAREWARGDRLEGLLTLPRRMTADLLSLGERPVRRIVDVGSGPGAFLEVLLDRLPEAQGVWTDVSPAMLTLAKERLGRFGDRVEYRTLAAGALAEVAAPGTVDAVVTSRVTHHLAADELARFYADADRLLGQWGWIANLDHVGLPEPWAGRLSAARRLMVPPNPSAHGHDRPHPALEDHLDALATCDGLDVVVAWRAYATVLLVAGRGT